MYRHLTDDDLLAIMRELETAGYQATVKQECQDPYTNEYYTVFTITYFEVSLSKPQIKLRWSSGKTSPFHGGITSSILVRSITQLMAEVGECRRW